MTQIALDFTTPKAPRKRRMTQRSYSKYSTNEQNVELRKAGVMNGGCVPLALSRALAKSDNDADSVRRIAHVVDVISKITFEQNSDLRFNMRRGAWTGPTGAALKALGIKFRRQESESVWVTATRPGYKWDRQWARDNDSYDGYHTYEKAQYPTVAQWMKANPNVRRAVIRTQGHAAFIDRGSVYGASARYRVKDAYIIEEVTA